jgi:tetratricopeptide (TPR) repeat protein
MVRPWLQRLFGVVAFVGACVGVSAAVSAVKGALAAQKAQAAAARSERQSVRVHATPAPVPQALPLLGQPGTDPDGYPRQYVDRAGLRALLGERAFKDLTAYFDQFQSAFEGDPRKEYWPSDAADAFESAEPEIVPSLDAWVAATPDSFAPFLARGTHYLGATWAQRGFRYRAETPEEDMRAMRETAARAVADLDRALELRPGLVAAMRQEMRVALSTSDRDRASRMREAAFRACPGCLQVRVVYMNSLTPRWGGSYEALRDFAAHLSPGDNPRFPALGGYVDFDRAERVEMTRDPKRFEDVLVSIDRALRYGTYSEYLFLRAQALRALDRLDEALATLDQADALRPMDPALLAERAALHCNRNEYIAAGRDLLTALRVDPTEPDAKRYTTDVMKGLLSFARASDAAGKRDEALEAVRLVLDLCPDDEKGRALEAKILGR